MFTTKLLPILVSATCLYHPFPPTQAQLSADPIEVAVEPGETATLTCSWAGETNTTKESVLQWSRHRGTNGSSESSIEEVFLPSNLSSRVTVDKGVLTIDNATWSDAGDYYCRDDTGSEPATFTVHVFNMPGYSKEGLILTGIGAVLLVVVLVGSGVKVRSQRRTRKEKQQTVGGEESVETCQRRESREKYKTFQDGREITF